MFDGWRERRRLRREIAALEEKTAGWDDRVVDDFGADSEIVREHRKLTNQLRSRRLRLETIETDRLINKVRRQGIELPSNKSWWWDDLDDRGPDDYRSYLTNSGKAGVSKLIREERKKSVEWWVKIIMPILSALIALLGLLVGLVSVYRK